MKRSGVWGPAEARSFRSDCGGKGWEGSGKRLATVGKLLARSWQLLARSGKIWQLTLLSLVQRLTSFWQVLWAEFFISLSTYAALLALSLTTERRGQRIKGEGRSYPDGETAKATQRRFKVFKERSTQLCVLCRPAATFLRGDRCSLFGENRSSHRLI